MKIHLKYIICLSVFIFQYNKSFCTSKFLNGKSTIKNEQAILLGINYGTTNKFGFDLPVIAKSGFTWGLGCTIGLGHSGVGKDYSKTIGPNAFPNDIYEKITSESGSYYGIIGYKLNKFVINSKIGIGNTTTYYNAYDKSQILAPNGYYFTSSGLESKFLAGINFIYTGRNLMPNIGFDNYNGVCIGINIKFL